MRRMMWVAMLSGMPMVLTGCDLGDLEEILDGLFGGGVEEPTDPGEDCEVRFEECLQSGVDPAACEQELNACSGPDTGCEVQPDGSVNCPSPDTGCDVGPNGACDPPTDTGDDCEKQFEACVQSGVAPEACEEELLACVGQGTGQDTGVQPPGDPNDPTGQDTGQDPDGNGGPAGNQP